MRSSRDAVHSVPARRLGSKSASISAKIGRTLYIRQKAKRGEIQPYMKTQNGERDVDLCTSLAAMLKDFIGTRTSGLLFCTSTRRQILQTDILRDSLHPILKKLELVKGGFNIFRRFRITELQTAECPKPLQHFWSGHAQTHVSERYTKLLQDRDYRLEWAEKIGMGFELRPLQLPHAPHSSCFGKRLSHLESGGREGIRTPGLLVANEATILIRLGAATT